MTVCPVWNDTVNFFCFPYPVSTEKASRNRIVPFYKPRENSLPIFKKSNISSPQGLDIAAAEYDHAIEENN